MITLTQQQTMEVVNLVSVMSDSKATRSEVAMAGTEAVFSLLPLGQDVAQTFWTRLKGGIQNIQDTTVPTQK